MHNSGKEDTTFLKKGSIIYDVGEKSLASFFVSEIRKQVSSPVE
ncbi:hypothetical protein B795N_14380 [Marinilactibacillus psychrotolerans]|nr:hypothetical protein B795N_14380 [Marinilactibacillus psychrotolerans]